MKKFLVIFVLIFSCLAFCGCDSKSPYLTFNSQPITQKTVYSAQKIFAPSQTIHYAILMPKGFKQEYLRLQIVKKPDNVPHGGLTIFMAKDIFIDKSKNFYIDKFVIHQPGCYMIRFFYGNRTEKPFVENILWVQN